MMQRLREKRRLKMRLKMRLKLNDWSLDFVFYLEQQLLKFNVYKKLLSNFLLPINAYFMDQRLATFGARAGQEVHLAFSYGDCGE